MIPQELYEFGPYVLDAGRLLLRKDGGLLSLPPKELETLLALVRHRGEVVTKQQLMETVWPDTFVEEGNLTQNISQLRRTLGKTVDGEDYIRTLPKRGYRIGVPVIALANDQDLNSRTRANGLGHGPVSEASQPAYAAHPVSADMPHTILPKTVEPTKRYWILAAIVAVLLAGLGIATASLWRLERRLPRVSGYSQLTHDGILKTGFVTQAAGPVAALVTDGARIYFNEGGPANVPALAQVSAAGGETSAIPTSLGLPQLLDIAPNKAALLIADFATGAGEGRLWSVPVPAGTPRSVAEVGAWDATWSPDGREIAYVSGQDLYRSRSDGTDARELVHLPGAGWRPRWSPDGRIIRLTLVDTKTGLQSLWEVTADGNALHPMLPEWNAPSSECCGNWTPGGLYFVFQATRNEKTEIWAIRDQPVLFGFANHAPNEPFQLTSGQLSSLSPVVSPDGQKLYVIGRQRRGEVERWDANGQQWIQTLDGISAEFVEYSPDRQWITYVSFPDGNLWKSRIDGTERIQLTFAPVQVHEPHWSPDAKFIAFHGYGQGTKSRNYKISADGGQPEPLTDAQHHELAPSWSPDGRSIAFSYAPFVERSSETLGVFILDLATHEKQKLPDSDGFIAPAWSPDGRYLAATAIQNQKIALFDFRERKWTELASGYGLSQWSRDSKSLYYLQYGKDAAVMRIRMADRRIERVASLSGVRQAGSMAGLVFSLAPDGSPIILRDTGTEEIYSLDWENN